LNPWGTWALQGKRKKAKVKSERRRSFVFMTVGIRILKTKNWREVIINVKTRQIFLMNEFL
jgi:hypothetical protein